MRNPIILRKKKHNNQITPNLVLTHRRLHKIKFIKTTANTDKDLSETLLNLIPYLYDPYIYRVFFVAVVEFHLVIVFSTYIDTQDKPVFPQSTNQTIVDLSNMENVAP